MIDHYFRADLQLILQQPHALVSPERDMLIEKCVFLDANESPWDEAQLPNNPGLNRYPQKDTSILGRIASQYGVTAAQLLVTRGSDDAIDWLLRLCCMPCLDAILCCPPTFGMYAAYAKLQQTSVIQVPLLRPEFSLDCEAILAALTPECKLIFLCSPNNPTGNVMQESDIFTILEGTRDKTLVVVDEAYLEFSNCLSISRFLPDFPHLIVLRTFSKAYGLAGVRAGALLANAAIISAMQKLLPPFLLSSLVLPTVFHVLKREVAIREHIALIQAEKKRVSKQLALLPMVQHQWPSEANFILLQLRDCAFWRQKLQANNILVRHFDDKAPLENCIRITIGQPAENDILLAVLQEVQ